MEERSRLNKTLYKIELCLLKIIPMLTALMCFTNTVLSYMRIDLAIFSYIAGMSFIPLLFMYVSSYVFQFCEYHRLPLYYIAANNIISIVDYHIGIPLENLEIFCLNMIIAGIALFIIIFLYVKSHKKPSSEGNRRYRLRKLKHG